MLLHLDRNSPVPIYLQLTEWIRAQIQSGEWWAGQKLTAEGDLADQLAIARGTVRKAYTELLAEGLLTRTHGRGTYVTPKALDQPLADRLITYSEALIAEGIPFETQVLEQRIVSATPAVAAELGVGTGDDVFFLKRIRTVDGEPLILFHNYVVYQLCPGIESADFSHERLFHLLEDRYGLRLEWGKRTFQAQIADETKAEPLGVDVGDSIMHMDQTTYLKGGTPIEHSNLWLRGNRFRLSVVVERGDPRGFELLWTGQSKQNQPEQHP